MERILTDFRVCTGKYKALYFPVRIRKPVSVGIIPFLWDLSILGQLLNLIRLTGVMF